MASNDNINSMENLSNSYQQYYKSGWRNNKSNNTPIIAEALNQLERQLKEVYDAVGTISTEDIQSNTPLQSAVTNYKNSIDTKFTNLLDPNDQTGETAKKATSVNITTQEAEDANVKFQVGSGIGYEKTINNVEHANSANRFDSNKTIELTGQIEGKVETSFNENTKIETVITAPVVTYTTTEGDYAAEDEIVFICGDSQPYR